MPRLQKLNDNDINRFFGWVIFKVKTKYKKQQNTAKGYNIIQGKLKILTDMVVVIQDVIRDKDYI